MIRSPGRKAVAEGRFLWANMIVLAVASTLLVRVWYVQIYKGDYYKRISENNRIQYMELPAPRGMIFDRTGKVVLGNRPYFDLVYIPQFVNDSEGTFRILSRLLHVPVSVFERRLHVNRGLPKFLPISLKRNLSLHEVAVVQSNRIYLPGIDIAVAPRRDYDPDTPSHMVGYLGEINRQQLKRANRNVAKEGDLKAPYRPGDLIGKQGLESRWEKYLRGKRGHRLIQVDAFGRRTDSDHQLALPLPQTPPQPGSDLILTLDMELQRVAKAAFNGKNGAVVALDPRNGAILAMVSEPGYDPNIYQGVLSVEKYRSLLANPFKPFLDKTTGGSFIPGSVYKPIVAMAAFEEKIIDTSTQFNCPGYYVLGSEVFHCHDRGGHGMVNYHRALMKSCDIFFYHVGVELGVDRISRYAAMFGLGQKLNVGLNLEMPGLLPSIAWKRKTFGSSWTKGETPSVAIGQGAVQMTPMQMATLYGAIGNAGRIWRPYLVSKVVNHVGETIRNMKPELIKTVTEISPKTFQLIENALRDTVMDQDGTGNNAMVPGHTVAGKTGTVQVVSLSKNTTKLDVSMRWREHAMFGAFSPAKNAEIAVAVVSEHDKVGGGGKSAAPVAGAIIEAYWRLKEQRSNPTFAASGRNVNTSNQTTTSPTVGTEP